MVPLLRAVNALKEGLGWTPKHPYGSSQPSATPVLGDAMPFFLTPVGTVHTGCT